MTGIYKITSPSGRIYIGQSIDIDKRFESYRKLKCKLQPRLYSSIVKYGVDNHVFEIIETCDVLHLNNRERHWQDYFSVIGLNGLNCILTNTEDKIKVVSDDTKEKIRSKTKLYKHTDEAKKKIIASLTGRIPSKETCEKISKSQIGKTVSADTCDKISKALLGRKLSKECLEKRSKSISGSNNWKAKIILDLHSGIYYGCITEAADAFNIKRSTLNNYLIGSRPNKTTLIYA